MTLDIRVSLVCLLAAAGLPATARGAPLHAAILAAPLPATVLVEGDTSCPAPDEVSRNLDRLGSPAAAPTAGTRVRLERFRDAAGRDQLRLQLVAGTGQPTQWRYLLAEVPWKTPGTRPTLR